MTTRARLRKPVDIGDVDRDGITDFAIHFRRGKKVEQWLDAVSGKTGERIWRMKLPKKLVGNSGYNLSSFCQIDTQGQFQTPHRGNHSGRYRDRVSYPYGFIRTVAAWPPIPMAGKNSSKDSLLLVGGSKLIVCDATTGQATDFNQGQPLELGFVPATQPKLILSAKGDEQPIGVLLSEIVSVPDENKKIKPVTRFSMRSLDTGEELWHFDSACDLNWTGVKPDWPLVADLNGDGVSEILITDGADLEKSVNIDASCQSFVQALDARTGQPIWDSSDVVKIRSQDRQVQHLLMGPDADGDLMDDVYVVSPMLPRDKDATGSDVYIDILSAATGKRIRTTRSKVPVFERIYGGVDFEEPFFLGVGADGHPRLVVATTRSDANRARQSTVLISTGTGEATNVGDELECPLHADGDGDGVRDLFLIKPRSRAKIYEAGQLLSIKSNGGREQTFVEGDYLQIDDVDDDGVHELLNKRNWQVISGTTGERLWQWDYRPRTNVQMQSLDKDIDDDGTDDFLVSETLRGGMNSNNRQILLTLISGRKGRVVWQKQFSSAQNWLELLFCLLRRHEW